MTGALHSEWVKLRSVRSTYAVLALVPVIFALVALMTMSVVNFWDATPSRRDTVILSPLTGFASWLSGIGLAILGVLTITNEHSSGLIRTSFTVVPQRTKLLAAKAVVLAGIAFVVGQLVEFGSFFLSRAMIGDRTLVGHTSTLAEEAPRMLAAGSVVIVYAMLGLGLGTLLRSTAGAISALVAYWYVVPLVTQKLPGELASWATSVMLTHLPEQLAGSGRFGMGPELMLSQAGAALALALYVALALGAASIVMRRRDA
ncbi:ABC transporter permease [Amycolatopsis sp. YIM 10]|uniref:ABC transporter permease n=1 Tax=Amycolatopsis sp. YIM 10 TaxID=2653857 RepID=UPI0012906A6F|nr:ABC transporter permease [Amycolatopsis sp. YIM 10]QFU88198.1 ABC-2 family transporter protein [Amycolatopsis sp. YIM 10]